MQWLTDNWIWVLLIGGMLAMHLFGHGHGGHGGHGGGCGSGGHRHKSANKAAEKGPEADA